MKTAWLESKTLQDRIDSSDTKPLMLTFHQADMSSCGMQFDLVFRTLT